jgi:Bacterial SH3 domain
MWRYLTLLCAGLFLVFLIGGRDAGQVRQGLLTQPIHQPLNAPKTALAEAGKLPQPDVAMANFVPVATPAPAEPPAQALPAPVEASAPAEPAAPAPVQDTVFSLADTPAADEPAALRWVSANAINVREGPGTSHAVAGRLTRGEAVTVVADAGDGWVRIRIEGDGLEGYVAARLLADKAP